MSGTSRKISELVTASIPLAGNELMVLVQDGETRQVEVTALRTLSPVVAVNGKVGSVLITIADIPGTESLVVNGAVSTAIASVSVRVDDLDTALSAVSVRVDDVSAAITSVQAFLVSQISVATSGVFTEAPNDGQVYGRQSLAWVPVSITALQSQINAVSVVADTAQAYDFCFAASDEITPLTTGTAVEFSFPRGMDISDLVLEVNTAPVSTTSTFVVRTSASAFHSGQIHIDPSQRTSRTAAVSTSLVKTSVVQWTRGYVDVSVADPAVAGLKVYILGKLSS